MVLSRATVLVSISKSINSASRESPTILLALLYLVLYLAGMTSKTDELPLETKLLAHDNGKPYVADDHSKVTEDTCFEADTSIRLKEARRTLFGVGQAYF